MAGSIAYAAQTPWILNTTVEKNITFNTEMDRERYKKTLHACQLSHDLEVSRGGSGGRFVLLPRIPIPCPPRSPSLLIRL